MKRWKRSMTSIESRPALSFLSLEPPLVFLASLRSYTLACMIARSKILNRLPQTNPPYTPTLLHYSHFAPFIQYYACFSRLTWLASTFIFRYKMFLLLSLESFYLSISAASHVISVTGCIILILTADTSNSEMRMGSNLVALLITEANNETQLS